MAEGSELMNRLMSENADLKKQVRLMKENQMLKRLLSESCQERCGLGGRDLLFPKGPAYPDDCSPGSAGLSKPRPSSPFCCVSSVADFGRFASVPDAPSQLQTSSLEDLLCSHAPISSEDDASPGYATSSQVPFKAFLSSPELRAPRGTDRKLSPLLSPLQDPLSDKTLLEPREMVRPKKVCFSESSLPSGDRTRRSYYLNEIQSFSSAEKDGRIVGEIAFQLDRRILAYVFPGVTRLYGFTVSNIPEKIKQTSIKSLDGSVDEKKLRELTHRYLTLTARLERLGYNRDVHPVFSEFLINTYGILKQRPDLRANPLHSSPAALRKLVIDVVPPKFLGDSLLLLTCLCELSKEDHKPLFAW